MWGSLQCLIVETWPMLSGGRTQTASVRWKSAVDWRTAIRRCPSSCRSEVLADRAALPDLEESAEKTGHPDHRENQVERHRTLSYSVRLTLVCINRLLLASDTSHSARNIGFIFDEHLTSSDQITSISKAVTITCVNFAVSGLTSIRQLPGICIIATSIVQSKLDYCNSLYYKLPKSQLSRLQQVQDFLARTVAKDHKSCHITPIYALSIGSKSEHIECKLLSFIYKVLTTTQPP